MNKLVSIIVPVYNAEKYLEKCIESIVRQQFDNLEVILIDDGSTDLSGMICDCFAAKYDNISVIHSENCGVSAARNKGLDVFKGEYVMFVDADDILLPDAVKKMYIDACETEADMCIGKIIVQKEGKIIKNNKSTNDVEILKSTKSILQCMIDDRFYSCYGKIIKRSIAEKVRYVEGRKIHEDGFYIFQCLLLCKTVVITLSNVYAYIVHTDSVSHECFSKKFYDILFFKEKKVEIIEELYPEEKWLINELAFKHDLALLNKMASCDDGYSLIELKKVRKNVLNQKKYIYNNTLKEKIRLFLISYFFSSYLKIMRRNRN